MTVGTSSIYPANIFIEIQFSLDICVLSQPVQEPAKMTKIIVDALEITGQRGIINKGWGGLGECKSFFFFFLTLAFYYILSSSEVSYFVLPLSSVLH